MSITILEDEDDDSNGPLCGEEPEPDYDALAEEAEIERQIDAANEPDTDALDEEAEIDRQIAIFNGEPDPLI